MKPVTAQAQAANPCRTVLSLFLRPAVVLILALLVTLPVPVAPAQAQDAEPAREQAQTVQDLEALVATLEDDAERQQLIDRLKTLLAASQPAEEDPSVVASLGARLLGDVSDAMGTATREMLDLGRSAEDLPQLWDWLAARVVDADLRAAAVRGVLRVTALLVAALVAFFVVRRLLAKPRNRLHGRQREPRWYERIFLTLGLLLIRAAPVGALLAVGYGVMPALDLAPASRVVALVILTGIATVQGIMIAADLLLQPADPSLRWLQVSDETAHYLQIWTRRLALVGVIGFFGAEAALTFGLPEGAYQLVTRLVGFVMALLFIIVIMQSKQPVAAWIRSRRVIVTEAALDENGETTQGDRGGDVPPSRPLTDPPQPVSDAEAHPATPGLAGDSAAARQEKLAAQTQTPKPKRKKKRKGRPADRRRRACPAR